MGRLNPSSSHLQLRNPQLLPRPDQVHVVADHVLVGFVEQPEVALVAVTLLGDEAQVLAGHDGVLSDEPT